MKESSKPVPPLPFGFILKKITPQLSVWFEQSSSRPHTVAGNLGGRPVRLLGANFICNFYGKANYKAIVCAGLMWTLMTSRVFIVVKIPLQIFTS